jgi:hypothetical protein
LSFDFRENVCEVILVMAEVGTIDIVDVNKI